MREKEPQLSDFYGLIIWIYWDEDKSKHKEPHIHAERKNGERPQRRSMKHEMEETVKRLLAVNAFLLIGAITYAEEWPETKMRALEKRALEAVADGKEYNFEVVPLDIPADTFVAGRNSFRMRWENPEGIGWWGGIRGLRIEILNGPPRDMIGTLLIVR